MKKTIKTFKCSQVTLNKFENAEQRLGNLDVYITNNINKKSLNDFARSFDVSTDTMRSILDHLGLVNELKRHSKRRSSIPLWIIDNPIL